MTIQCFNLWPMAPIREALRNVFPQVSQERLSATTLQLTVSEEDFARLAANLETLQISWKEI